MIFNAEIVRTNLYVQKTKTQRPVDLIAVSYDKTDLAVFALLYVNNAYVITNNFKKLFSATVKSLILRGWIFYHHKV